LVEFFADLWEDLGAEQLDALEDGGLWHAADVHLEDLAVVAERGKSICKRSSHRCVELRRA
jgi:hypothetical protein